MTDMMTKNGETTVTRHNEGYYSGLLRNLVHRRAWLLISEAGEKMSFQLPMRERQSDDSLLSELSPATN